MLRFNFLIAGFLFLFSSCRHTDPLVNPVFADSLMNHFTALELVKVNEAELAFWKKRIKPESPGLINEARYASALINRFHLWGDIRDVQEADSLIRKVDTAFNHKEAGPIRTLISYSIMQHRFKQADQYLQIAKSIGLRNEESLSLSFDVDFEHGRFGNAHMDLNALKPIGDFGYYFRRSRMDHLNGELDSSISAMMKASTLSENVQLLKQVALSNTGDLYIHAGKFMEARDKYVECIRLGTADFHSVMGLGWIALIHDGNDSLAERLFLFVHLHNKLPDALYKLVQVAQARGDSISELSNARTFVAAASDSIYERMYNKYLIEIYTEVLNEPAKALNLSRDELNNRATPQTYAWYCWCLLANDQKEEAYKVFEKQVSGKPLEGLELFWMGKLMLSLGKGYNAQAFFKAAYKDKYDLSPRIVKELEKHIE